MIVAAATVSNEGATPDDGPPQELRCHRLVLASIKKLALDLRGLVILTEAATGYYMLTPLIAALAGADRVYAITRDSAYGTAQEVAASTIRLATRWGVASSIQILRDRYDARVRDADIVTNLGVVRPLDSAFLARLSTTVVIPLMWETWEYRADDVDLAECRRRQIPVLGTNEHHPDLETFEYVGLIALKLVLGLDIEIRRSSIIVIGSGQIAAAVHTALDGLGALVTRITPDGAGAFVTNSAAQALENADAIVVAEHQCRAPIIGANAMIVPSRLQSLNPSLAIAHICGGVDGDSLREHGFRCAPARFAAAGYMSLATDYVGPRPLVDLHTAGLRVGAVMAEQVRKGLRGYAAEVATLGATSFAHGFAGYHAEP